MIKAVIFDVDGVLLDSLEANHHFFTHLLTNAGYQPPTREAYKKMMHMSMWHFIEFVTKSESKEEIQRIWENGVSKEGIPSNMHLMKVPQGLDTVIKNLSKTYTLGIVTSRESSSIFRYPELEALKKYFSVTIAFEDTENHKPHPEPIIVACQRLSIKPHEAIYIGDTKFDLQAAKAAGTKSILYAEEKIADPDGWTNNFIELPGIVKSLENA